MIPIKIPANTGLYNLAMIARATGNMLVIERWKIVMRPASYPAKKHPSPRQCSSPAQR